MQHQDTKKDFLDDVHEDVDERMDATGPYHRPTLEERTAALREVVAEHGGKIHRASPDGGSYTIDPLVVTIPTPLGPARRCADFFLRHR